MATIQDIFDWLNQGAQGDIPGTGGGEPNAPAASQPGAEPQATPTPQDYAGDIPSDLVPHYHALVQGGVPPQMAHMILTQPGEPQGQQQGQKEGSPTSRAYEAGKGAGTSIMHLLFGAPSQQSGQSQGHQGVIDMLSNWFSPPPQQSSDADLFTGGL